jgi:ferredoxin-thioredoxin reductase catalytic subunit
LYLYINSRGEIVSPNESVKANLLKGLSDKKTRFGDKMGRMAKFVLDV